MKYLLVSILVTVSFLLKAQHTTQFFDSKKLMETGTYYYPEQWPENEWERDIKNISDLGFEFTHYGEFAWSSMEPEEGKFDFTWLDKAIELSAKYKLKVILCTPTPTPPAWLTTKHPEILMVNAEGRTIRHGARQQASWSSPVYREYVEKIVTELAKRYAGNKAIWGWQIDNEPSHYGGFDYSENAQTAFRKWLEKKYTTIDVLNKTWGTAFWSQTYNNFEQIRIPNAQELVAQINPHALLDFKRFTADDAADFVLWQQDLLKKHIPKTQWVTTNLMADYSPVDPLRFKNMDIMSYTKYLVAGFDLGIGEQGFRMGSPTGIGFANDWFRNINGTTSVMELQPGQVNWGKYNPQTMPGAVRMWIYHVFAGDNRFVCNYRFRQPLTGAEQYHYGIMKPDGITVSTSGDEYVQFNREIRELRKKYDPKAKMPQEYAARKTAILYNPDNRWETENQPQTNQWDFITHIHKYYRILQSFGAPVDIIDETHDFSAYPVMIAPAYQLLDKDLIARWKKYAENGGNLVLTCRTGQKDRNAHLWNEKFAAPIYELIGAREIFFDVLPEYNIAHVRADGYTYEWNNWADIIDPYPETEVWGVYDDQFYRKKAAITTTKTGKGTVTYIGPDTDEGDLETAMLRKVYERAEIKVKSLPRGVILQWRHGFWIALNYSSRTQNIDIPEDAEILIGRKELAPAGVVVWK